MATSRPMEPVEDEDHTFPLSPEEIELCDGQGGSLLHDRLSLLEKTCKNLVKKISELESKSKDVDNRDSRDEMIGTRIGRLLTEKDALLKELNLVRESERILRCDLARVVEHARVEREELKSRYEEQIRNLKAEYVGDSNKAPLRLISQLQYRGASLEESYSNKSTCDVQFVVKQVPNNDSTSDSENYVICYSCKEAYSPIRMDDLCQFHPLPAMKKATWEKNWLPNVDAKKYQNYRYWPCCNTLARKRPTGCCKGRHHQQWESDILLKKAIQADPLNKINMLQRSKSEVHVIKD